MKDRWRRRTAARSVDLPICVDNNSCDSQNSRRSAQHKNAGFSLCNMNYRPPKSTKAKFKRSSSSKPKPSSKQLALRLSALRLTPNSLAHMMSYLEAGRFGVFSLTVKSNPTHNRGPLPRGPGSVAPPTTTTHPHRRTLSTPSRAVPASRRHAVPSLTVVSATSDPRRSQP